MRNVQRKPINFFIYSAGVVLLVTAVAKLISGFGSAHVLQNLDPIMSLPFSRLMIAVGALELAIAGVCFFNKSQMMAAMLVAWFSTALLVYRMGLLWMGWQRPCHCLGNLTDALHISPQTADTAMKIILAYLLIGSYATLFWLWRQRKKSTSAPAPVKPDSAAV